MRKLKTIFSVLLAICLLLSSFTVAFAEETGSTESTTPATHTVTVDGGGFKFFFLDLTVAASEGQSTLIEDMKVPDGSTVGDIAIINDEPLKTTENFLGWKLEGSDSAELWTLDKILKEKITSDMKFTAQWTEGFVTPFNNGYDKNVTFETGADTIGLEITANFSDTPINKTKCYIPVGTIISDSGITGVSVIDALNADAEYTWNMYVDGSETPSIENIPHSEIPKLAITGTTVFRLNTSSGETTPPTENPDAVTYNVRFDTFEHPFNFFQPGYEEYNGTRYEEVCTSVPSGMSPAEVGIEISVDHDGSFLGWCVFEDGDQLMNPDEDAFGEPLLLSTEEILTREISCNTRYLTHWKEAPTSSIHLNAEYSTFDITYDRADGSSTVNVHDYTNFLVEVGDSLKDIEISSISDPVYWNKDRAFLGWVAHSTHDVTDDNGYTYEEYGPIDGKLLSSDEVLVYPSIEKDITFEARWAGNDSDYFSNIYFDGVGGQFDAYWGPDSGWEHSETLDSHYIYAKENGQSISEEQDFYITSDPVREGYTFEGWLVVPDEYGQRHKTSRKLYSTKEILNLTVPHEATSFMAKWKEIPLMEYRYGSPHSYSLDQEGSENWFMLHAYSNNAPMTWDTEAFPSPLKNLYDISFGANRDDTFLEGLNNEGYGHKSWTIEKEKSTFNGWDVYTYEQMYTTEVLEADVEKAEKVFAEEGFTYFKTYGEHHYLSESIGMAYRYVLLINPVYYSNIQNTEDLLNLKNDNFVAFANWSDWVDIKVEGTDDAYMLDINTAAIAIPQAAQDKYDTVEKAKEALKAAALTVPTVNKDKAETVYYEITLKVQKADGTWETVTPENFPKEGLKVTIPYNGLDPEKLDFVVTHLISSGEKAGEIEVLEHKEGKDGLEITVNSLSPFAVTYQNEEDAIPEATATPEPTAAPAPEKNPNDIPPTGDNNAPLFFLVLMATAAAALFLTVKKLRKA